MCFLGTLNEKCVQFPVRKWKIRLYHCTLKWMICFLHNLYLIFARVLRRDGGISWQGGGAEHVRHQLPVMRSQPWWSLCHQYLITCRWCRCGEAARRGPRRTVRTGWWPSSRPARCSSSTGREMRGREGETKRSHWPLLSTQLSLVTTCNLV